VNIKGDDFVPRLKTQRRRRPRPYNHSKKVSGKSPFTGMRKKNRGQG